MSQGNAEQVIVISAMIVGGVWAYQQYQEGGASLDFTKFATAWGAVFLVIALMALAAPGLAAAFAMLVVVADILANGSKLIESVTAAEGQTVATTPRQPTAGAKNVAATHAGVSG